MRGKYTREKRLAIGQEIYEKKLSREEAAVTYSIDPYTAREYFRMYKATLKQQDELAGTQTEAVC